MTGQFDAHQKTGGKMKNLNQRQTDRTPGGLRLIKKKQT
jgi:hypothetical protein